MSLSTSHTTIEAAVFMFIKLENLQYSKFDHELVFHDVQYIVSQKKRKQV